MRQFPIGTLTLLFTDIEGSTRLLQRLGRQYAEVLRECRRLLRAAFEQYHGYEVDTQGDAFFVVFERATDAIMAAIAAQKALSHAHWPCETTVRVRMGIHTGEPEAVDEGYVGLDVHLAARIMSAAHGGQVLLSATTQDLVVSALPDEIEMRDLGEYRLKDISGHTRLFQLVIPDLPSTFPPLMTASSRRSLRNIPCPTASFVGREREIELLSEQLCQPATRLLTLIGPGGVGKTRLALHIARLLEERLDKGICFVSLERVREKNEVIAAIAQALDIQEEPGVALIEQVKSVLRAQITLLLLDNFEQVLSARLLVADLLSDCPNLKVLVTSRIMLHLQAEHLFEVAPFQLPGSEQEAQLDVLLNNAAIALFVQRAQAVQPGFQLTSANAADVVDICAYVDGIPLAIELAAAHTRHFTPQKLLVRLKQGAIFLQGKAQDVPERQQTLRKTIAWSYDLLEPEEQYVFRRIAVYTGGATVGAAEAVCTDISSTGRGIGEILEDLVDKSMVQRQDDGKGGVRFWLLQILREYGIERLSAEGAFQTTQAARSTYMLSWVEHVTPLLAGAEQVSWLDQLDREYENIRATLTWLLDERNGAAERIEQALQICVALMRFWEIRSYFQEGLAFLERALASEQKVSPMTKAQALHSASYLALMQDETSRAEVLLRESQLLFRESGDKAAMANILRLQGKLAATKNSYKIARRLLEEALTIDRESGNIQRAASTQAALAQIAIAQGSYSRALSLLEENLAAYKILGEHYNTAYPLYFMACALYLSGQEQARARELAERSLALFRAVGNNRLVAFVLDLLGQMLFAEHENGGAGAALEESMHHFKEIGDRYGTASVLISLARFATVQGNWERARSFYEECWGILQALAAKDLAALCLEGYGEVLVTQGETTLAVRFWGTAAKLRSVIVAPMPPVYRASYLQAVSKARKELSEDSFQSAWSKGSLLTLEQIILV